MLFFVDYFYNDGLKPMDQETGCDLPTTGQKARLIIGSASWFWNYIGPILAAADKQWWAETNIWFGTNKSWKIRGKILHPWPMLEARFCSDLLEFFKVIYRSVKINMISIFKHL